MSAELALTGFLQQYGPTLSGIVDSPLTGCWTRIRELVTQCISKEASVTKRATWVLTGVLLLAATEARGEDVPTPEALESIAQLHASAGPRVNTIARDGRLIWAGSIDLPVEVGRPQDAARAFLSSHAGAFGLGAADEVTLVTEHEVAGVQYLRFEQRHDGRPVIGAQAVISIRDGRIRHVANGFQRITSTWPATTVTAAAAARAVEVQSGRGAAVPQADDLAWMPLGRDGLLPVWIVTQRSAAPARDWRYLVEATTGTVLWRHDQFLRADGLVWDPNPIDSEEVARVELPGLPDDAEVLEGEFAQSFRCVRSTGDCSWTGQDCLVCGEVEHLAIADDDGNFLFEPEEPSYDDPFSEVQGYYHATRINDFFGDVLGFERRCNGSRAITIYVNQHYVSDDDRSANAFYGDADGDGCGDVTMGEGRGIDFAYDGDVIYHEFTHGIVEAAGGLGCPPMGACTDSLGLDFTALGLNEGFADYFAVSFTDDPELGEHAWSAFDGLVPVRDATNDHLCPFDLVGESHYDGEILSATGWEVRELLGAEITDRMMMATLLAIGYDADYAVFGAALLQTAQDELDAGEITEEDLAAIELILGPEGRRVTGCERIVPLDAIPAGHHEEFMQLGTYMGWRFPGPMQWSLTTPRRATSMVFEIETQTPRPGNVMVHVRAGEPVGVAMNFDQATMTLTTDYEADASFDVTSDALVLEPDSDFALEDETTYYFAIEYSCDRGCPLRARGTVTGIPNELPTAVAGEDQEVEAEVTVELDGNASSDPEGGELTFVWEQLYGPTIELEGADNATPSFEALEAGEITLQLTVTDEEGGEGLDEVVITVTSPDGDDAGPEGAGQFNLRGGACSSVPSSPRGLFGRLISTI